MGLYFLTSEAVSDLRLKKDFDSVTGALGISLPQRLLLRPGNLSNTITRTDAVDRLQFCRRVFFDNANEKDMYVGLTINFYDYPENLVKAQIIDGDSSIIGLLCSNKVEAAKIKKSLVDRDYQHQSDPSNQETAIDNGTRENPDSNIVFIARYIHPSQRKNL